MQPWAIACAARMREARARVRPRWKLDKASGGERGSFRGETVHDGKTTLQFSAGS